MKPTNQSFKLPRINWKSAYLYITAFLIPFLMLFVLHLVYNGGFGNPIVNILSPRQICFNGLAGACFLFYIRHTDTVRISNRGWQLVFSFAYGLCSYGILQEGSISALCLYAVFPLAFLSFEKMIDGLCYLPFLLAGALILIISPSIGIPVFLFLLVLTFIEAGLKGRLSPGNAFHYLGCFALCFLLAAFRVFPHFESVYNGSYSYNGFSTSCSPFVLLSRFLPGAAPSISFFGSNGIDLYFGLFFLLSFVLFFFSQRISVKKRLSYGCFTFLVLASLWLSPIRFLLNLLTDANSFSVPHSFFLVFWMLRLALEAVHGLKDIPTVHIVLSTLSAVCILLICYIGSTHNFNTYMLPVTLFLFLFQTAFLFFRKQKGVLFFLILLEFGCNAFITTNLHFIPAARSIQTCFLWDTGSDSLQDESLTEEASQDTETYAAEEASQNTDAYGTEEEKAYNEFISSHENKEILEQMLRLMNSIPIKDTEKKTYCGTAFPDQFQLLNGSFKKIGGKGDLFSHSPIDFIIMDSEDYRTGHLCGDIYYFSLKDPSVEKEYYYIPFTVQADSPLPNNLYLYNNITGDFLQLTTSQHFDTLSGCMRFPFTHNSIVNFQMSTYILNDELAEQVPELIDAYLAGSSDNSKLYIFTYIGLTASCIGILIMLTLYMNKDKAKVYQALFSIKDALDRWKVPVLLKAHIKKNQVYYLSFFIPFLLFVASMVLTDCVPFGNTSLFCEDGFGLTLPSALDTYYSMKDGNTYLSMNGGYGTSLYARKPMVQLSSYYRFLSPGQIAPLLLFMEALFLGLCGVSMVFFMTHRLHGIKSRKEDYRLLVPALIYALNSYMLAMHNYTSWFITLAAFPLLMAAMDHLMYKKKCLPYVLLLSFCIATDPYLGLYICIFLAISFFTCRFHGIKDFFTKGLRFGFFSLLGAGNCYFILANLLQSTYDSGYNAADDVFPTFGLHTSFLEQWKKHMIFSEAPSVSSDNGLLNIYCGILTMLLVLIYFFAKKVSAKEKLKKLLPVVLLYVSFNEQVLSYLWGGFHYQTKVPNRFAFLLLFLIAELSYEGIRLLRKTSALTYSLLIMALTGFFLICQFLSKGNSTLAWSSTLILCTIYLILHLLAVRLKKRSSYPRLLVLFLIAELSVNMLYISTTYSTSLITLLFDYPSIANTIEDELKDETGYCRICFPSRPFYNLGQIYHAGSNNLFNSFVSQHQCELSAFYGFSPGSSNSIIANYPGTPFGLSLSSHRYLFLPASSANIVYDLDRYKFLGYIDDYYIFENTSSLSLGIYAPLEAGKLNPFYLWQFYNDLASLYTGNEASLFIPQNLEYVETETDSSDSFHFLAADRKITYEEAVSLSTAISEDPKIPAFWLRLKHVPLMNGTSYLYANEFIPLGKTEAGVAYTKEVVFSSEFAPLSQLFCIVTMNEDVFDEFIIEARKNQLENIEISNDTITGTTNYEKDGYTMLSLACDRSWHAYIDGKEVEIEDPYDSFMLIKTPAGKHTLELKYIPYGMKTSKVITLGFWSFTIILFTCIHIIKKRRKNAPIS